MECLSLDPDMRDYIRPFLPELKEAAENLPRLENEDAGLMARGILVNLGEMDIKDLHGPEAYKVHPRDISLCVLSHKVYVRYVNLGGKSPNHG